MPAPESRNRQSPPRAQASVAASARPAQVARVPLPPFDEHGNLPVGDLYVPGAHQSILHTTLSEIRQRFVIEVADSNTRPAIWNGWMEHRLAIESFGLTYSTWVNGSFCTNRLDPGDVDLCYFLEAAELDALVRQDRQRLLSLLAGPSCKAPYMCDVYAVPVFPSTHPNFALTVHHISYWTRVFGFDRNDYPKSILMVTERGTL